MENAAEESGFLVRMATLKDAAILTRHRCEMFRDMGVLRDDVYPELHAASISYYEEAIPSGVYVAWLVAPMTQPELIVAGGGMQLRRVLPRPGRDGGLQRPGPQGLIVNVYTEKEWRRRGLAELIMRTIIEWSHQNGVPSLVLHASEMGRSLYERLGFTASNEMLYPL